ncbi:MAG: tyrosine-type recombinase/integrase [Anaerolineae bacterium]|nr:tyrosine-type recombinase/integrase [Anaerolineae bacterium]
MAALPPAMARNQVVVLLLCTLVLRREEVSALQWGDVTLVKNRPTLRVDGALLEIPRPLLAALDRWRALVTAGDGPPPAGSPLVRRIWKGGRIARRGLSPDGIWLIIHDAARYAGLEQVSPEDLRRSVVLSLRDAGTPIEALHSLLRHRTLIVTRRFLAKLPPAPAAEPPDEPL